jgi:transposase
MVFVEHEDGRKLSIDAQEKRRKTIVRMKKRGHTLQEIQDAVGLSKTAVCKALNTYAEGGWSALRGGKRGRRKGENRSLTPEQEKMIRRKIVDRRPEQLKLDFALWTRDAVRQLILQECAVDMPIRTVREYLKRWGFTPQRPARFAYERRDAEVNQWLEQRFPTIRKRAKAEDAEIYWGDETGMRASDVRGRGYAPRGERPGGERNREVRESQHGFGDHQSGPSPLDDRRRSSERSAIHRVSRCAGARRAAESLSGTRQPQGASQSTGEGVAWRAH